MVLFTFLRKTIGNFTLSLSLIFILGLICYNLVTLTLSMTKSLPWSDSTSWLPLIGGWIVTVLVVLVAIMGIWFLLKKIWNKEEKSVIESGFAIPVRLIK